MAHFGKSSDIRMGLIGYGGSFSIGAHHLREGKQAGMRAVAVAELDPTRRQAAKEDFPEVETYDSVGEMLASSDANLIAVLTPHNSHSKLAVQCLKAGKHVVVEKPMAINTAQCDAMIRAARDNKRMLSVYQSRHWDGCIMEAARRIGRGQIGDVLRIRMNSGGYRKPRDWWRASRSISGGILFDWGAHLLEYAFQILDAKIVEVSGFVQEGHWAASSAWGQDANEDEATAVMRFEDGRWASLRVTSVDMNPPEGAMEVTGTKGSYIMNHREWRIVSLKRKTSVMTSGSNPDSEWWRFYRNVARHLTSDETLIITPELSRRIIHVLDLAGRSADRGRALKPKYE